jgi:hypothetical protein
MKQIILIGFLLFGFLMAITQTASAAPKCIPDTCAGTDVPAIPGPRGPAGPRGPQGTCSAEACTAAQPFRIETQTITAYCPTSGSSTSVLGYTVMRVSAWPDPLVTADDLNGFCVTASSDPVTAGPIVRFGCGRSSSGVQGIPIGAFSGEPRPDPTDGGPIPDGIPPYPHFGWEITPTAVKKWGVISVLPGSLLPRPGTVEKQLRLIYVCVYPPTS